MSFRLKMTACLLVCGAGALLPPLHAGDGPSAPDLATDVKQLIADLDADRLSVRRAAEERLLKLGPPVLDHLPPLDLIPQPGVRQILTRLRVQLENQQARLSAKASHVTLSGTYPLRDVLQAIAAETGNKIDAAKLPPPLLDRNVDVDFQRTPFWAAVDRLAEQLSLRHEIAHRTLVLDAADDIHTELGVAYSGPFRVGATSSVYRPEKHDVRTHMVIQVEPRLHPLIFSDASRAWSAETGDGRRLQRRSPDAVVEQALDSNGRTTPLMIDFVGAVQPVDQLSINGKVSMTTAAGEQSIRFTDLDQAEGVARRRGGVTVRLTKVTSQETPQGKYDVRIEAAVMYDAGGPAFESHHTWIYHNQAYLETAEGKRIDFLRGDGNPFAREGAVVVKYAFLGLDRPLGDYRFVFVAPTLIVTIPVSIRFDGLRVAE